MRSFILVILIFFSQASWSKEFVVTAAGDTGFSHTMNDPAKGKFHPEKIFKYGNWLTFDQSLGGVKPAFQNSHVNFVNMESIVADDLSGLKPFRGGYRFATHINAARYLITELGINLFALANNHAYDFGVPGMVETVNTMGQLKAEGHSFQYAGIDTPQNVFKPIVYTQNGVRIAFASINGAIGGHGMRGPKGSAVTLIDYRNNQEYSQILDAMAATDADLKILSIHFGEEKSVYNTRGEKKKYRQAVDRGDIDIVIGHAPHRTRSVEHYKNSVIFYSLGNFMLVGSANLDSRPVAHDFGAIGKVYFNRAGGSLSLAAVEMIPIKTTHMQPYVLSPQQGARRVAVLNKIAKPTEIQFEVGSHGTGLYCIDPKPGTQAGSLCSN